jgi:hypothetical protein
VQVVAIDKSGKWWIGSADDDVAEYLRAYQASGYSVSDVVPATCTACSSQAGFSLRVDADEGFAERTCQSCGTIDLMLDSADVANDADPHSVRCPCGSKEFDVAVGFSRRTGGEVRWVSVGIRCREDGVLGCAAEWKID